MGAETFHTLEERSEEARLLDRRRRRRRLCAQPEIERRGARSADGSHHEGRLQAGRGDRASRSTPPRSEFYDKDKKKYVFKKSDKSEKTSEQMVEFWSNWVRQYPIISIEDGMAEDDWDGWKTA